MDFMSTCTCKHVHADTGLIQEFTMRIRGDEKGEGVGRNEKKRRRMGENEPRLTNTLFAQSKTTPRGTHASRR